MQIWGYVLNYIALYQAEPPSPPLFEDIWNEVLFKLYSLFLIAAYRPKLWKEGTKDAINDLQKPCLEINILETIYYI